MFEQFIRFILSHNLAIIQWLIFAIVGVGVMALGMMIFGKDESPDLKSSGSAAEQSGSSAVDINELATKLKEVMASVAQTGSSFAGGPLNQEQMSQFQAELQTKKQEVEELKKAVVEAQAKSESADVASYLKKIKDLENRLAEYEILEDDIADLSLFKEENARLKEELARVKGGGAPDAAASAEPEVVAGATVTSEEIVEEFQAAIDESKDVVASSDESTDGFMAALEDEVSGEAAPFVETEPTSAPTSQTTASQDVASPSEPDTADDLLSEFAAELGQEISAGEASGGELDADKMLAELSDLEEVDSDGSALEELTDMDKMASEASTLLKE